MRVIIFQQVFTALQFKTGSTNVHNVGIEVAQLNVLGGAQSGSGLTITHEGNFSSGISTAFRLKQVHLIYIM